MCAEYGADTFRVYEMSMGPLDMSRPWETRAVVGSQRFLQRLWRNVVDENTGRCTVVEEEMDLPTAKMVARAIAAVTEEYDNMRMNTVVAQLIVLNNYLTKLSRVPRSAIEPLIIMVAPLAPHIAEELWQILGHQDSLTYQEFPIVTDKSLLVDDNVTCVVQINGKLKYRLEIAPTITESELEELALSCEPVRVALAGETPIKVIVRAPKLVNVVIRPKK